MNALPKTILVPTDFGDPAEGALDHAVALAQVTGAKIILLYVCPLPVVGFPEGAVVPTGDLTAQMVTEARRALDDLMARRKNSGVAILPRVEIGDPRETIQSMAQELGADLIVMGTHGRRGIPRALIGSVTEWVVRTATRPVLTIRGMAGAHAA
jgi:nucleotide-binding universal stress UspA family protein